MTLSAILGAMVIKKEGSPKKLVMAYNRPKVRCLSRVVHGTLPPIAVIRSTNSLFKLLASADSSFSIALSSFSVRFSLLQSSSNFARSSLFKFKES